jgi:hypothetical protein
VWHVGVTQNSKGGFRQVWGEYARTNSKHVAMIDQMDREVCKDHYLYRLFIEGIDKSFIQVMKVKLVHSMFMYTVARSRRCGSNSGCRLLCSLHILLQFPDSMHYIRWHFISSGTRGPRDDLAMKDYLHRIEQLNSIIRNSNFSTNCTQHCRIRQLIHNTDGVGRLVWMGVEQSDSIKQAALRSLNTKRNMLEVHQFLYRRR